MPLFMDVHDLGAGVAMEDVAKAHQADLADQGEHDVSYLRYWVDESAGQIFCLVEAPDAEAANTCTARPTASWRTGSSRCRKAPDHLHPARLRCTWKPLPETLPSGLSRASQHEGCKRGCLGWAHAAFT